MRRVWLWRQPESKGIEELLERTHLIVGVGGGERDEAADETILQAVEASNDREGVLNDKLLNELRPTLFLAQLPNLFAGNISIVHGVTGSSRTFMGEEGAGVDAVRIAFQRIQAGQGDLFLVGSAYNAARRDLMLLINPSGVLAKGAVDPLWQRTEAGMCLGSMGAFLVVESPVNTPRRAAPSLKRAFLRCKAIVSSASQALRKRQRKVSLLAFVSNSMTGRCRC